MKSTNASQRTRWRLLNDQLRSTRAQLVIVIGMLGLYTVTFRINQDILGDVGAALITLPVLAAGWYFGRTAGLTVGIFSVLLNSFLAFAYAGGVWGAWLIHGWPGNVILLAVGYGTGVLKVRSDKQFQMEIELRNRERYFAIINHIIQDILAFKHSDELYFRLITLLANLFVADYAHLMRWDPTRKQVTLIATTVYSEPSQRELVPDPSETNISTSVLESENALFIEDISTTNYAINPEFLKQHSLTTSSVLCIPLILQDFKFGSALLAFNTPRHFTPDEIRRAEETGKQITLALWTIQQESEIQKRLKETQAIAKIAQSLSETEQVGIDHVLQLIVDSASELIPGTQQAVIHLLDEEQQMLVPQAVSGFENPRAGQLNMRLGEGVAGQVIETGEVVSIADVDSDFRFISQDQPVHFRSLMVAPVESGERRLGTISVQSEKLNAFSIEQQSLLLSLGTQAAIAIGNAHLLETTQQGLKEINALYHITQGLAASLDTAELMQDTVDLLQQNFGYYQAEIFVIDPETEDLVVQQASGKIGALLKGQRLPAGAGIVGHAADTGEPFFTNDVEKIVFFYPHPLLPDTHSELALPIKVNNRVLGVLDIQQCLPGRLTERDLQLVSTVAEQLAVSLQKADLYSNLQTSLQQEKSMRSQLIQSERLALVGRLLASVSHELNNPLQAIQNALFLLKDERGISTQGQQDLQIVLSEAERMAALIDRLRTSYRPTYKEDFQTIQLNSVVEDIYALASTHLRHNQIAFEFHPDPNLPPVAGLPDQMRQVILNLLMNASEAMPDGGRLTVTTERISNHEVSVSVSDTGNGIEEEILPKIFDAFVTNKETGTGLGLTITYDIIHRHNGRIIAENAPGGGAKFTFWLPTLEKETP